MTEQSIIAEAWGCLAQNQACTDLFLLCRWVYRNPFSILDPTAVDLGKGSRNGSVNSFVSDVPRSYKPRLRYNHMATLSHLPNGSISAQWQASLSTLLYRNPPLFCSNIWGAYPGAPPSLSGCVETLTRFRTVTQATSGLCNPWRVNPHRVLAFQASARLWGQA